MDDPSRQPVLDDQGKYMDGLKLEKEIHRSNGNPRFDAVIRFTNTAINPPLKASLFTVAPADLPTE